MDMTGVNLTFARDTGMLHPVPVPTVLKECWKIGQDTEKSLRSYWKEEKISHSMNQKNLNCFEY